MAGADILLVCQAFGMMLMPCNRVHLSAIGPSAVFDGTRLIPGSAAMPGLTGALGPARRTEFRRLPDPLSTDSPFARHGALAWAQIRVPIGGWVRAYLAPGKWGHGPIG
jgi:hypothetical protein